MSTKYLFALLLLATLAIAVVFADDVPQASALLDADDDFDDVYFEDYKSRFGKQFDSSDEPVRKSIYKSNRNRAKQLQAQNPEAEFGDTPFMDLTPEEFVSQYLMKGVDEKLARLIAPEPADRNSTAFNARSIEATPASFDWRSRGAVTPVKNQGQCGSCWAFSVAETIESALFLAGRGLKNLAPQQIVSCDQTNYGCNGGWPGNAYNYVKKAGGLELATNYPYVARKAACTFDRTKSAASISGWAFVSQTSSRQEAAMTTASYTYGPLSVCLCASSWQYYTSGVLSNCCTTIDHCVQITGWGTQSGIPYWNVRNSWGTNWGSSGYIKIRRGSNTCRIADYVTRAIA